MISFAFRHRAYVAFAITTLAVAVGVNLVVFTVVNALWLRPLPVRDADRFVTITGLAFIDLRVSPILRVFESVAGQVVTSDRFDGLRPHLVLSQVDREIETVGVTPGYFRLFGLAIRGRDFTDEDNRLGAEPVAIISDRLWSRAFGRRPEVVGGVAGAKPFPIRIIGVAPVGFVGARRGEKTDVWIPSNLVPRVTLGGTEHTVPLLVFARLYPGQTPAAAARHVFETALDKHDVEGIGVVPLRDAFGTPELSTIVIREGGGQRRSLPRGAGATRRLRDSDGLGTRSL
jgi:putative ABC transport system permease protein